jgi:ADP-ribose pyrophosphatase YjhB (NUDIX family)
MTWKPHVTVAAIVEQDGRFLCVEEEVEGRVVYNQPAGHLDPGESLVAACAREALEETAWRVEPYAVIGLYRLELPALTYLRVCFAARALRHDGARALDAGILAAPWLTRAELAAAPDRLRSPLVLRCLDDYLAGTRFPLAVVAHA